MFQDLMTHIDKQLSGKTHVIVAISGFGGSGKSTLADRLARHYNISDAQIMRLDNLFAKQPYTEGIFDDYDWPLIIQIMKNVRAGKRIHYRGRGFSGERPMFDAPLPRVVIFEGVRLFRPEMLLYSDIRVWINCPKNLAIERGKARDRLQGADEKHVRRWDTEWGPLDDTYFTTYHPEKQATLLYEDYQ